MQSSIDVPTSVCESGGMKRAASPPLLCLSSSAERHQPLPRHELPCPTHQVCQNKRLRTSLKTQNTSATSARAHPSIVWRDFRNQEAKSAEEAQRYEALDPRDQMSNMIARTVTPFTSTQHSKQGIEPPGPGEYFNFFTRASVKTPKGVVDLEVQVDEGSPFNLVPWSIAANLDLMLYSGKTIAITIAHHLIQTNNYSQFTIGVAGHNTTIDTVVISGLQTILLGREWIRSVHLLSDFRNQRYYIAIPLVVEVAEKMFSDIVDNEAEAKDVKPVAMATSNKIAEGHGDDEFRKSDCGDDPIGKSSQHDSSFSESKPSFDGQNLLDGNTPSDEISLDDATLSDAGTRPISDGHEVTLIGGDDADETDEEKSDDGEGDDQYDQDHENDEDEVCWEDFEEVCDEGCQECIGFDECGCEYCNEYNEREGCEECNGFDECGCEYCNEYNECEGCEECEEEAHRRQSESMEKIVLPSSNHADTEEQPAVPDPTRSQVNAVQARITTRQRKEITHILNHISRTPAGQSFKAPVEQLWPEFAGAYTAKVSNPIDLGTIQMKVKNNIYPSVDDFRADIVLLYQNSVEFNGIDHMITSIALEVRDTILNALNDMEKGNGRMILRASTRATV